MVTTLEEATNKSIDVLIGASELKDRVSQLGKQFHPVGRNDAGGAVGHRGAGHDADGSVCVDAFRVGSARKGLSGNRKTQRVVQTGAVGGLGLHRISIHGRSVERRNVNSSNHGVFKYAAE